MPGLSEASGFNATRLQAEPSPIRTWIKSNIFQQNLYDRADTLTCAEGFFFLSLSPRQKEKKNDIGEKWKGKEMEMKMREKEGPRRGGICSPAERKSP